MKHMSKRYNVRPVYWNKAKKYLSGNDIILKKVIQSTDNKHFLTRSHTPFQTLANAIIGQQISVTAASSVLKKLKANIGGLSPSGVYNAKKLLLKKSGLSRQKIEYLTVLADKFVSTPSFFYGFKNKSDEEIIIRLCSLKGIGEWTAQMYLIFQLNRPNVLPLADIGFINSMVNIYKLKDSKITNIIKIADKWGDYKTVAVWHIWRIIDPDVVQY